MMGWPHISSISSVILAVLLATASTAIGVLILELSNEMSPQMPSRCTAGPNREKDGRRFNIYAGGDPKKDELNVWNARFTFNEAGEIFYTVDGKITGNMYCHIGNECWKYCCAVASMRPHRRAARSQG